MQKYIISSDSTADLPLDYIEKNNIEYLAVNFTVDEKEYSYKEYTDLKNYYDKMRSGMKTNTMQAHINDIDELFRKYASQGIDIVHIAFSSSLSGTYNTEKMVAEDVMNDYPNVRIEVIDSLAASGGQGLIVRKAVEKRDEGFSFDELVKYVEDIKFKIVHYFTVEDMIYLYRGGRVSKGKAIIANVANIKPVLNCNEEGKLIPLSKARGRKKSLKVISEMMKLNMDDDFLLNNPYIVICHADSIDDAKYLGQLITDEYGVKDIKYEDVGPTIGAHSGPGTIALFYQGLKR